MDQPVPVSSTTLTLEAFFKLGRFHPATVQRQFQWTAKNADVLMADIQNVCFSESATEAEAASVDEEDDETPDVQEDEPVDEEILPPENFHFADEAIRQNLSHFFVGTVILGNEEAEGFAIFDGLQRLTTLTVLLAVLRDLSDDEVLKKRLDDCIFDGNEPRLRHRGASSCLSERIQAARQAGIRRNVRSQPEPGEELQIFDVSRIILDHIKRPREPADQDKVAKLAHFVLEQTLAVALRIASQEMARHVFVATNLYGQPLIRSQVAKGEFLELIDDPSDVAAAEEVWNGMRDRLGDQFDDFLIAFDILQRARGFKQFDRRRRLLAPGTDPVGELVAYVRAGAADGTLNVSSWLQMLDTFSWAWADMMDHLKSPQGGVVGNYLWRQKFFAWKEWQSLALFWWERYRALRDDDPKIEGRTIARLAMLHQRCLMIELYSFSPEDRRDIFLKSVVYSTTRRRLRGRLQLPDPFTKGGATQGPPLNFSRKVRRAVRSNLELSIENYATRRAVILYYEAILHDKELPSGQTWSASVEHILPVKPVLGSHWLKVFKQDDERYFCLHSIGNLGLIDRNTNADLGEKEFAVKRRAYAGLGTTLLSISDIEASIDEAKSHLGDGEPSNDWTPTVIRLRTQKMARRVWTALDQRP
ncbi:MAG: hypothetical protein ACI9XZ_002266 [Alphaproteobacteria bacterium]|jgi:hypothetical protein